MFRSRLLLLLKDWWSISIKAPNCASFSSTFTLTNGNVEELSSKIRGKIMFRSNVLYKVFWKRAWTDFNQQCHGSFVLKANMTRSQVLKLWESTPDPAKLVAEQYSLGFDNGFLALSWLISNLLGRHRRLYVFVSQGWEETCYSSNRPKPRRTRPFSLPLQSTTILESTI